MLFSLLSVFCVPSELVLQDSTTKTSPTLQDDIVSISLLLWLLMLSIITSYCNYLIVNFCPPLRGAPPGQWLWLIQAYMLTLVAQGMC